MYLYSRINLKTQVMSAQTNPRHHRQQKAREFVHESNGHHNVPV
jgi:hypothetical protein